MSGGGIPIRRLRIGMLRDLLIFDVIRGRAFHRPFSDDGCSCSCMVTASSSLLLLSSIAFVLEPTRVCTSSLLYRIGFEARLTPFMINRTCASTVADNLTTSSGGPRRLGTSLDEETRTTSLDS